MIRLIPVLQIEKKRLVKTISFKESIYLGDPINAVRIFNEKEVDELVLLDISASRDGLEPDYEQLKKITSECFIPTGYGGGIKTLDQVKRIIDLGVEKVVISSSSINYKFIEEAAYSCGSQSVVVCIDAKKTFFGGYKVYGMGGTKLISDNPILHAKRVVDSGAGEVFIQSIDQDGKMKGFDIDLTKIVTNAVSVPVVALGGAGSLNDIKDVLKYSGATSVAAGSIFVFKGKHKGILISYPGYEQLSQINM
jgi:cyclase